MQYRNPDLLDDLVGAGEKRRRHVQAKRLGGLEVDHELELDCGLDGKFARFRALENAVGVRRRTSVFIDDIRAVRDQAADFSK
jgi:hypothetical protein